MNVREIDILWNNGFRHVFNCCWQESVKPLQFYCHTLPLSYQLHERQLLFYRRLLLSDNIVLRTLAGLPRVRFEMLGIAAKYDVDDLHKCKKLWFIHELTAHHTSKTAKITKR